jgi:hypothetical protein
VAGQTFRVVRGILADKILMRVVASQTTDPRIGSVEASAIRQAVGLEADVDLAVKVAPHNAFPRAMALTAKIR